MKTILVPVESHEDMAPTFNAALLLAQQCGSYIEGFAYCQSFGGQESIDVLGTIFESHPGPADLFRAKKMFEEFMLLHSVPHSSEMTNSLSFGWRGDCIGSDRFIGIHARIFDVLVLRRPVIRSKKLPEPLVTTLFRAGRPVLLVPARHPKGLCRHVAVVWDGSAVQARTISLALPLLRMAEKVSVLSDVRDDAPNGEAALQYLCANGIRADLNHLSDECKSTAKRILEAAKCLECSLLIKGADSWGCALELWHGGGTLEIVTKTEVPLFLAA